jgi:hypothetical protein
MANVLDLQGLKSLALQKLLNYCLQQEKATQRAEEFGGEIRLLKWLLTLAHGALFVFAFRITTRYLSLDFEHILCI